MKKMLAGIILFLCLDQLFKHGITSTFQLYETSNIIPGFLRLTYVQNIGAAWNIMSGNRIFLIAIAVLTLIFLFFYIKKQELKKFEKINLTLLIAGILGNLLDRIFYGYVIDYIDINLFSYNFPVFNFADILIVVSAFAFFIYYFLEKKS